MSCEHFKKRWTLYAADQLDWQERAVLDSHLIGGCQDCEAELKAASARIAQLWLSLDPIAPGPQVKQRLMAKVAWTDNTFEAAAARQKARTRRWMSLSATAACAAAVAAAFLINDQSRTAISSGQASSPYAAGSTASVITEQSSQPVAAVDQPTAFQSNLMVVPLQGSGTGSGMAGRLLWDRTHHVCHILAPELTRTPPGKVYHLWFLTRDGQVVMTRSFAVASDAHGDLTISLPAHLGMESEAIARATITFGPERQRTPGIALLTGRLPQ